MFRHPARLVLTILLLSGAFSMIVCFKGFKTYVLNVIQDVVIDTQFEHLQIARQTFWSNQPTDQAADKMILKPIELKTNLEKIPGIEFVIPRLGFYGLINREGKSVVAHFVGLEPKVEARLQKALLLDDGSEFSEPKEVLLSATLGKKLKVKSGGEVTLVSPTLDGGMNAMDLQVRGIFRSGLAEVDNGTAFIGINDAQKILDTTYVDQLLIRAKDEKDIPQIQVELEKRLQGTDLKVKNWRELAELFNQVETFYVVQNLFIEVIILLLLFLSVANTMTMSVFERTSEIGTLRALGDYETDIQRMILMEAVLLGLLSILIGIPLSFLAIEFVSALNISFVLPMASRPVQLGIVPTIGAFAEAALVCFVSVVLASIWPARKGARIPIVSALSAKI